jgi:hypothetical protein
MAKYTQWHRINNNEIVSGEEPNLETIAFVDLQNEQFENNAQLIVAAPEMYAALKAIIAECPHPKYVYGSAVVKIASDVLASIDGGK